MSGWGRLFWQTPAKAGIQTLYVLHYVFVYMQVACADALQFHTRAAEGKLPPTAFCLSLFFVP